MQNKRPDPGTCGLISIWEIMKRWIQGDAAFIALIKALQSNDLQVVGRKPADTGLRALLVERQAFFAWHQTYRHSLGFLTIPETAHTLGMNKNLLYHLIKKDIILADSGPLGDEKRSIQVIRTVEIERFCDNYTWGHHLGDILGMSAHAAARHLLHQSIAPVCGPEQDGAIGYVFRREDIAAELKKTL